MAHPRRSGPEQNPAFQHLPVLLAGPLVLLLLLALGAGWSVVTYPWMVGGLFVTALVLPWLRPRRRRAPPLGRALGERGIVTRSFATAAVWTRGRAP